MSENKRRNQVAEIFANRCTFNSEDGELHINEENLEDELLKMYGLERETVDTVREMDEDLLYGYGRAVTRNGVAGMRANDDIGKLEHRIRLLGTDLGFDITRPEGKDGKINRRNFRAGIGIYTQRSLSSEVMEDIMSQAEDLWGEFED